MKTIQPADDPRNFCSVMSANLYEALHCEGGGLVGNEGEPAPDAFGYSWTSSYNKTVAI